MRPEPTSAERKVMEVYCRVYGETHHSPLESWEKDLVGEGPGGNPRLTPSARAYREVGGWSMFLLLTPWRLARILIPPPGHEALAGYRTMVEAVPSLALGPLVQVVIDGMVRKAHVHDHPELGVHLVEPLVFNMTGFQNNDEVFQAHDRVIESRDRMMAETGRVCAQQSEISRRELFAPLFNLGKQG